MKTALISLAFAFLLLCSAGAGDLKNLRLSFLTESSRQYTPIKPQFRRVACGGQYAKCNSDADCCVGWVCL